ncbi:chemotaxis protein [Rhizobium sp. L1K21]|uniref:chemotaxis protein n=1 Tax=Rhizobium sp. L1K21 TaxID=2954933 RepID=UPI002093AE97|nr:chemotaxis protein [Rhizobium sp. L1K21]MCO6187112.1 chemotaxis protein [Rhizobium sp. L1K21]
MRKIFARLPWVIGVCIAGLLFAASARADDFQDDLPPYKMLRSLQSVQDSVAKGDTSAAEMQRFMLGVIDKTLRQADSAVFEDPRNVDAALVYAMSGGNPDTLKVLVQKDVAGRFDNRVTEALLMYLSGKGSMAKQLLEDTVPEYKTTPIGPYLALVAANAVMQSHPAKALEYFDWARLILPGTIVEEAALRRSLSITVKNNMVDKAKVFFRRYFERFPLSPYSSQVADLFVEFLAGHYGPVTQDDIVELLRPMPDNRKTAVYLRIARRASLDGQHELGQFAAAKVLELAPDETTGVNRVARLYLGLANLPAGETAQAGDLLSGLSNDMLGPQERRLRNAAEYVLDEIVRPIPTDSLTQAQAVNLHSDAPDAHDAHGQDEVTPEGKPMIDAQAQHGAGDSGPADQLDPELKQFIASGREKLTAIDALLGKDEQ